MRATEARKITDTINKEGYNLCEIQTYIIIKRIVTEMSMGKYELILNEGKVDKETIETLRLLEYEIIKDGSPESDCILHIKWDRGIDISWI